MRGVVVEPLGRDGEAASGGTRGGPSATCAQFSGLPLRLRAYTKTSVGAGRRPWPPWGGTPTVPCRQRRPPSNQGGGAAGARRRAMTAAAARASGHHPVPTATRIAAAQGLVPRQSHSTEITAWTMAATTCTCAVRARPRTSWGKGCTAEVPPHQFAVTAHQCEQYHQAHSSVCRGHHCQQRDSCPLPLPRFPLASAAATTPLAGVGMQPVGLGAAGMEEEGGGVRGERGQGTETACGAEAQWRKMQ